MYTLNGKLPISKIMCRLFAERFLRDGYSREQATQIINERYSNSAARVLAMMDRLSK